MRVLQTLALPLGHDAGSEDLSGRWDSNPRPSPWQGDVLPLYYARSSWPLSLAESAETQDRTGDTAIFSRVLYQLSYLGQMFGCKACGIVLDAHHIVKQRASLDPPGLEHYNSSPLP